MKRPKRILMTNSGTSPNYNHSKLHQVFRIHLLMETLSKLGPLMTSKWRLLNELGLLCVALNFQYLTAAISLMTSEKYYCPENKIKKVGVEKLMKILYRRQAQLACCNSHTVLTRASCLRWRLQNGSGAAHPFVKCKTTFVLRHESL